MTQRLLLTPGEPAGIGPDLTVLFAQQAHEYELVAVADPELLQTRADTLGLPLTIRVVDLAGSPKPTKAGEIAVIPVDLAEPAQCGKLNAANGTYVLRCLDIAIETCQQKQAAAMITGPVQKSVINEAGILFSGHTEYLADKTDTSRVVMMLATEGLKVALTTTHLPLRDVADSITPELLTEVITILDKDLKTKFGVDHPKILVSGLNPHAGENGHMGREELDVIIPTLETLKQNGIPCIGPLPADTLFTPKYLDDADAVLAMFHDQGLPVLKYKGFGQAANITLGLPIIRTSVDHGTALDLAGTGNIDIGSLSTAIDYALLMAEASHQ